HHTPRELRIYRPSVPKALEQVIVKALSLSPADRYSDAAQFSAALESALRAPSIESRTSGASFGFKKSRRAAGLGAAVFAVLAIVTASIGGRFIWGTRVEPDSTKYVVLPVEAGANVPASQSYDLLLQAFSRWKGITIADRFSVGARLGSDSSSLTDRVASNTAKDLGAGKYVRTRLTTAEGRFRAYAALFEARNNARVSEASTTIDLSMRGADTALAGLTRRLLLPDADSSARGTMNLPALRLYTAGARAQSDFSLPRAESLYSQSIDLDRSFAQAAARLAFVRSLLGQS